MIDKLFEIGLLYDFYSELLTPHQKDICRLYFEDNYTLGEIAMRRGSAVRPYMMPSRSRKNRSADTKRKTGAGEEIPQPEEEIRRARAAVDRLIGGHKEDAELISELYAVRNILDRIGD